MRYELWEKEGFLPINRNNETNLNAGRVMWIEPETTQIQARDDVGGAGSTPLQAWLE
jgi:hypothetical protein